MPHRLSSLFPRAIRDSRDLRKPAATLLSFFFRDDGRAPGKIASEQIMTLVSRKLLVAAGSFAIRRGNLPAIKHGRG